MAANPIQLSGLAKRLVEDGLIEGEAARDAFEEARKSKVPFVTHLVEKDLISPRAIANSASEEFGVPLMDLESIDMESLPQNLVNEKLIMVNHAIPLVHRGNRLFVAVADPTNLVALDEIKFHTGLNTEPILVEENILTRFIEAFLHAKEDDGLGDLDDDDLDIDLEAVDEQGGGPDEERTLLSRT